MNDISPYITVDYDICFGKPCIKGTRITVQNILQWLSNGTPVSTILADYPELREVHIRAALGFAAERFAVTRIVRHEVVA